MTYCTLSHVLEHAPIPNLVVGLRMGEEKDAENRSTLRCFSAESKAEGGEGMSAGGSCAGHTQPQSTAGCISLATVYANNPADL